MEINELLRSLRNRLLADLAVLELEVPELLVELSERRRQLKGLFLLKIGVTIRNRHLGPWLRCRELFSA